jgi:pimeloyl-ACP methyl ester carboxylesterase
MKTQLKIGSFEKLCFAAIITAFTGLFLQPVHSFAQNNAATSTKQVKPAKAATAPKTGYAPVNGLQLYYEIHGNGEPLVLLHGGLGAGSMFGDNLQALAKVRKVIAVDLQGHGRTADIDRELSVEFMADDIAALLKHLNIQKADIMGYSMGGGVALQTAIRHPEVVNKLIVASTPFKRNGFYPEILVQQAQVGPEAAEMLKQTPMYKLYASIAPKPEDWKRLLTKIGEAMKKDYDWSESIKTIKVPTLVIAADADIFPPAHTVELYGLLGGGQRDAGWDGSLRSANHLAIIPDATHYNLFLSPALSATAISFLTNSGSKEKW